MRHRLAAFALPVAVAAVLIGGHLSRGAIADLPALAMFSVLGTLTVVALFGREARRELDRLRSLALPAAFFALTIAAALWSLTPWAAGGPHPIWTWIGMAPSTTLDRSGTLLEIVKLLGLGATFLLGCQFGVSPERADRMLRVLVWTGGAYGLTCLLLFSTDRFLMREGARFAAGFGSPNVAGDLFGLLLTLTVLLGLRATRRPAESGVARITRLAPLLGLGLLFLFCLVLTASRAAVGATLLALALVGMWQTLAARRAPWPLIVGGGLLLIGSALLALRSGGLFLDRLSSSHQGDGTRWLLLQAHWDAFLASPLSGYGLGSFNEVNNQVMTSANTSALSETMVLHNVYLQWLVEAGAVGAAPMALTIAAVLAATVGQGLRRQRGRTVVVGLLACSLLLLVHASVDVTLNTPSVTALWSLLLGIGFGLACADARRA